MECLWAAHLPRDSLIVVGQWLFASATPGREVEHTPLLTSQGPELVVNVALGPPVADRDTGCWVLKAAALGPSTCDTIILAPSYCMLLTSSCSLRSKLAGAHGVLFNQYHPAFMAHPPPSYRVFWIQALDPVPQIRLTQGS